MLLSHEIAREIEDQLEYPGSGEGDRDPRVPRDRGREVGTTEAARRWADVWSRAWPAADLDAVVALYARDAVFFSHPFRPRQDVREYVAWAFADQASAECRFGEPLVDGDRAAVEWWGASATRSGEVDTHRRRLVASVRRGGSRRRAAGRVGVAARCRGDRLVSTGLRTARGYASPAMRRYHVTTFGCQMNAHDSERIKGMLESLGLGEATTQDEADVVVFNTCTIREKPDTRLAAYLGNAAAMKRERPDVVVAVGGCYAEAQRERIFEQYPFVDVAFGPGSIPHLGDWISAGGYAVQRGKFGTHDHFAADLPLHGERRFQAWVQVSMGCNSRCAYCIVPAVRGREQSRRPGDIVAEVTHLAEEGVREITLLGQNVNSWGRDLAPAIRTEFGELLRACDAVSGIERIRFTSPHPKDFREPVIAAMAECAQRMRARTSSGAVRLVAHPEGDAPNVRPRRATCVSSTRSRGAIPDLALGTDIIVGFPGETEDDFEETLSLVEEVRFDSAFTFIYSPRSGTEAASLPDQVPDDVKHERLERFVEVRSAGGGRAERGADRAGRGGARRGPEPHGSGATARAGRAATRR